jgi:hypothetical protein
MGSVGVGVEVEVEVEVGPDVKSILTESSTIVDQYVLET